MNHTTLSIIEYGVMPFCLVIATVATKYLTKRSSRIKWNEFLSIGLDIILMCSFAWFIYGVSVFNHFKVNEHTTNIFVLSLILSFLLFLASIFIALLIRHWGEGTNTSLWTQNIIGGLFLIAFLFYVSSTNKALAEQASSNPLESTLQIRSEQALTDSLIVPH